MTWSSHSFHSRVSTTRSEIPAKYNWDQHNGIRPSNGELGNSTDVAPRTWVIKNFQDGRKYPGSSWMYCSLGFIRHNLPRTADQCLSNGIIIWTNKVKMTTYHLEKDFSTQGVIQGMQKSPPGKYELGGAPGLWFAKADVESALNGWGGSQSIVQQERTTGGKGSGQQLNDEK